MIDSSVTLELFADQPSVPKAANNESDPKDIPTRIILITIGYYLYWSGTKRQFDRYGRYFEDVNGSLQLENIILKLRKSDDLIF